MKQIIIFGALLFVCIQLSATTFEFTNKRSDERSVTVEITLAGSSQTLELLPNSTSTITFAKDNKNIDILTLTSYVKDERSIRNGDRYNSATVERDVIYIAKKLTKEEKGTYKPEEKIETSDTSEEIIKTKAYQQKNLKGKTKLVIEKGRCFEGCFNVTGA